MDLLTVTTQCRPVGMPIGLTWEESGRPRCRTACGETQRVGIARAIVLEPSVLFLDEPTVFVDEESKTLIQEIIQGIRRDGSALVVITTHNRDQAERLSDTVLMRRMERSLLSPAV